MRYLILFLFIVSCSMQPVDLAEKGYLNFTGQIPGQELKTDVPECTGKPPTTAMFRLTNEFNQSFNITIAEYDAMILFIEENYCVDRLTIQADASSEAEITLRRGRNIRAYIPSEYDFLIVRAYYYVGATLFVHTETFDSENPYNSDGVLTSDDIIYIAHGCN